MTHFRALTLILAFSKGLIRLSLTDLEKTAHAKAFPFLSCFCDVMFASLMIFENALNNFTSKKVSRRSLQFLHFKVVA